MEILFITHKYPPTIGGMEKQSFELIKHIQGKAKVHTICYTGEGESKLSFFFNLRKRVKRVLLKNPQIDIIHLNDGLMGLFTFWIKRFSKVPVVITFHGLDLVFPNPLYQKWIKQKYTRYDAAICVSTATANACIERGFDKQNVYVVPNGVDKDLAKLSFDKAAICTYFLDAYGVNLAHKNVIITLGRPVKRKGFSWFLKNVVPSLDKDTIVVMVGPLKGVANKGILGHLIPQALRERIELLNGGINDEVSVKTLMNKKDIKGKVIQTGKLPFEKLIAILQYADIFAMPNIKMEGDMEGFGLVALEASICKAFVLASDIDGIPEAIQDQKNGLLLPSGDADAWINSIRENLKDKNVLMHRAEKFQQFTLEEYGWSKMAEGYIEVFEEIIACKSKNA